MATSVPLLSAPLKTTSDVDFTGALRQIIATSFGESPDSYAAEIAALNRCRQDALRGSAGSDVTARDLLYKYFGQLELLELRFPDIRVPFPWGDAFTGKQISQLSLAYEKASVIFNIAATLSSLGSTQSRASPEGLKRAFNHFRSAAGVWGYISDNFLHAPSTDLSREIIKTLVGIMTAQATEVFLERMTEEKKGAGLKARVCLQASALYSGMQEESKDFVTKGWFSRAWSLLIQTKTLYYLSLAHYHRATADGTAGKYGDATARLLIAETAAKDAQRMSTAFSSVFIAASVPTLPADAATSLAEMTKNLVMLCVEARAQAVKDNDLIYHAPIPSEASLPVIEKSSVAEPISIQEVYGTAEVQKVVGPDIFARLVPLSVHESASLYSEEKAKVVRAQVEASELADSELVTALEYMNLPASLAKFRDAESGGAQALADPGPARGWAQAIQRDEAEASIGSQLDTIARLRAQARGDLDAASRDLDLEQRECEQARVKFGSSFSQSPSAGPARNLRSAIKTHRTSLEQAGATDAHVAELWAGIQADVGLMSANDGGETLERMFAEAASDSTGANGAASLLDLNETEDDGGSGEIQKAVAQISDLLARLNQIKRERHDVLRDLKDRIQADDISHLLILNRKTQNVEPSLFAAELEKFRPHQNRIGATVHHQQVALNEVTAAYKTLSESPRARQIQTRFGRVDKRRKDLLARFRRAHEGYGEARAGVSKGLQFYRELSELARSDKDEAARFVASRASERANLIATAELDVRLSGGSPSPPPSSAAQSLEQRIAGLNVASSPPPQTRSPPPASATYGSIPASWSAPSPAPSYPTPPPAQPAYAASSYSSYSKPSSSSLPPPPPRPAQSSYQLPGPPAPVGYAPSPPPPPAPQQQPSWSQPPPPPSQPPSWQQQPQPPRPPPAAPSPYGSPPPQVRLASESLAPTPQPQYQSYGQPSYASHQGYAAPQQPSYAPQQPSYQAAPSAQPYGYAQPSYGAPPPASSGGYRAPPPPPGQQQPPPPSWQQQPPPRPSYY